MLEKKENSETTGLMTKKNITLVALLSLILVIAGVMMVFSSNNIGNQEGGKVTSGKVSAIEENAEQAGEDKERVGGLDYYNNTVVEETTTEDGKKKFTITNKYKGPIISAEKEVKTATELGYVVEGEEIEYTIIAKNDGGVAKDVVIKDPIVDGLEFVEGSIKVNGESTYTLGTETVDLSQITADDLTAGITVNVPAKVGEVAGVTKLSFKAKIKALADFNNSDISSLYPVNFTVSCSLWLLTYFSKFSFSSPMPHITYTIFVFFNLSIACITVF